MACTTVKWAVYWAAVVMAISPPHHAHAQEAAGEWHGAVTNPAAGVTLRIGITLRAKGAGDYEGMLTSPDQGNAQLPLDKAKVDKGVLSFSIDAIQGTYVGRWDEAKKAWVGEWVQGASVPLVLTAGKP